MSLANWVHTGYHTAPGRRGYQKGAPLQHLRCPGKFHWKIRDAEQPPPKQLDTPISMRTINSFYAKKVPLMTRGAGLFKVGDAFLAKKGVLTIIEVVHYGEYPVLHPKMRVRGYYRQYESYVVEDEKGMRRWPHIGYLLKLQKVH